MDYLNYALISLGISVVISVIISVIMILILVGKRKKRKEVKKEIKFDDIKSYEDMLYQINKILKRTQENEENLRFTKGRCDRLEEECSLSFKNIGLVRYKYLDDAGGNLSFSLALMDDRKNGMVFTNISLIDSNALYLRRITDGVSDIQLMEEEKEAIKQATER